MEARGRRARTLAVAVAQSTAAEIGLPDFTLDPQLATDSLRVADLPLSAVRLMRDANYPWCLLIPRRGGLSELLDLDANDQIQLMREIAQVGEALRRTLRCDKLNVAALGNMVRQLHVHVIARTHGDPAWPRPVWGAVPAKAYTEDEAERLAQRLAAGLRSGGIPPI
jgi:diadenosine tetraphosphate (Ap4A) HIT family hydrolase